MTNELTTFNEPNLYTSTELSKAEIYNLVSGESTPVAEIVGEPITLTAVYFEPCTYTDNNTGDVIDGTRTVICDSLGQTYSSLSVTLKNALTRLLTVFDGIPSEKISITINKKTRDGKSYYSVSAK